MFTRNSVLTLSAALVLTAIAFQAPAKVSAEEATANQPTAAKQAADQTVNVKKSAHSRKAIASKIPAESSENTKTNSQGSVGDADSSDFVIAE